MLISASLEKRASRCRPNVWESKLGESRLSIFQGMVGNDDQKRSPVKVAADDRPAIDDPVLLKSEYVQAGSSPT